MNAFKLYEINALLQQALDAAEQMAIENEGEISEYIYKLIEDTEMTREELILSVARQIKNCVAEADAIKAEEKKLATRRLSLEKMVDRLKEVLTNNVNIGEKISDACASVGWRKSEQCIIDDESLLPNACVKIERKPMLLEIKKFINGGAHVSGARIVEKQNIQVK